MHCIRTRDVEKSLPHRSSTRARTRPARHCAREAPPPSAGLRTGRRQLSPVCSWWLCTPDLQGRRQNLPLAEELQKAVVRKGELFLEERECYTPERIAW